jgi:hypothetical protein
MRRFHATGHRHLANDPQRGSGTVATLDLRRDCSAPIDATLRSAYANVLAAAIANGTCSHRGRSVPVRAALLRWDRSLYEAITALKRGYLAWRVPKKDLCGQDREKHGDCAQIQPPRTTREQMAPQASRQRF